MKFNFLHIVAIVAIILFGFSFSEEKFSDPNKEKLLIEVVKYVVEKGHYSTLDINDDISEKISSVKISQTLLVVNPVITEIAIVYRRKDPFGILLSQPVHRYETDHRGAVSVRAHAMTKSSSI